MICRGSRTTGECSRRTPAQPAFAALGLWGGAAILRLSAVAVAQLVEPWFNREKCCALFAESDCRATRRYPDPGTVAVAQLVEPLVVVQVVVGSSPISHLPSLARADWIRPWTTLRCCAGPVAQRIERRTSNPCAEVRLLPGPLSRVSRFDPRVRGRHGLSPRRRRMSQSKGAARPQRGQTHSVIGSACEPLRPGCACWPAQRVRSRIGPCPLGHSFGSSVSSFASAKSGTS